MDGAAFTGKRRLYAAPEAPPDDGIFHQFVKTLFVAYSSAPKMRMGLPNIAPRRRAGFLQSELVWSETT
jgi:hypothetical protein